MTEYIAACAMAVWTESGTAVSRAFLVALGVPVPRRAERHTPPPRHRTPGPRRDLMDCFENHGSPLDGRF